MDGCLHLGCAGVTSSNNTNVCSRAGLRDPGSVLTQFNLERLPGFEWSQQDAEMAMLEACAESNATSCEPSSQAGSGCIMLYWLNIEGLFLFSRFFLDASCVMMLILMMLLLIVVMTTEMAMMITTVSVVLKMEGLMVMVVMMFVLLSALLLLVMVFAE